MTSWTPPTTNIDEYISSRGCRPCPFDSKSDRQRETLGPVFLFASSGDRSGQSRLQPFPHPRPRGSGFAQVSDSSRSSIPTGPRLAVFSHCCSSLAHPPPQWTLFDLHAVRWCFSAGRDSRPVLTRFFYTLHLSPGLWFTFSPKLILPLVPVRGVPSIHIERSVPAFAVPYSSRGPIGSLTLHQPRRSLVHSHGPLKLPLRCAAIRESHTHSALVPPLSLRPASLTAPNFFCQSGPPAPRAFH